MRARARGLAGAALAAALGLACGAPAPSERVVVSRLGDAELSGEPAVEPRSVSRGQESRPGLCGGEGFALRVPPEADALRFALGTLEREAAELSLAAGGEPLARFRRDAGEAGWSEYELALDAAVHRAGVLELSGPGETACLGSLRFERTVAGDDAPPSIVLVVLDTLAAHALGSFGGWTGASPRIDAFLDEAFDFRRAYAPFANTLVSHSSLFSGYYPVRHGRYSGSGGTHRLPPLLSLVSDFAGHGYTTVAFTENTYVGSIFGFDAGFDSYHNGDEPFVHLKEGSGDSADTFGRALDWLETVGRDRRFLLFVHTYEVHSPYLPRDEASLAFADAATPDDRRVFDPEEFGLQARLQNAGTRIFGPRDFERLYALYAGELHYLDRMLERLLARVAELTRDRPVIVVLTSDHGEQFGEQGRVEHVGLHGDVLHVPLAFAGPGIVRGSHDAPVSLVDVFPTLLDLAGIAPPPGRDGRSLAPLLRGEVASLPERPVYAEERRRRPGCEAASDAEDCVVAGDAVIGARFKLVSPRDARREELFDLAGDPRERRDLSAERPEALARQRARLDAYRGLERVAEPAAEPEDVDAATRRRLEALGYAR